MKESVKYTLRKLGFLLVLATLIVSPFAVQEYKSTTTTNPYILMARAIESFELGGVDVLEVSDWPGQAGGIRILTYIEDYPNWDIRRQQHNFKAHVVKVVGDYDFNSVVVVLGWDYPLKDFRIQGQWVCFELRATSCEWEYLNGIRIPSNVIKWPGIGKP
jgi:hypothetical protein